MLVRAFVLILFLSANSTLAQHLGYSFEVDNEIGTYQLVSLTVTHSADNSEGVSFMINKQNRDTIYQIDKYLNGWVGLSRDGRTVAHLVSETEGKPLEKSLLTVYREGEKFEEVKLSKLISYELTEAMDLNRLSKKGWIMNDSILHKMASNPFFVSDDKLFVSFSGPKLSVFDLNRMFRIYTGNGANHFNQNYYSTPKPPHRTHYDWGEYIPQMLTELEDNSTFENWVAKTLGMRIAIPEEATIRVEITAKLIRNGSIEVRSAKAFKVENNKLDLDLSKHLGEHLNKLRFATEILPPNHPAWIFETSYWLN